MKPYFKILTLFVLIQPLIVQAANPVQITVVALDIVNRPVRDVRFSFLDVGAISRPTTAEGRTRVAISEGLKPGQSAELLVSRSKSKQQDWVFISPFDGRVMVPVPGQPIKVWLAPRGNLKALSSGEGPKAMARSTMAAFSKPKAAHHSLTEEQRKGILTELADRFGLTVEEFVNAILTLKEHKRDPHDKELFKSVEPFLVGQGGIGNITVLGSKVDGNNVQIVNNAPQGIAISGGNVTNPTVNNYAPPRRRIPKELRPELIAILAKKPMKVEVNSIGNDTEAYQYAQDWYVILNAAGWDMQGNPVRTLSMGGGPPLLDGFLVNTKGEPFKPGQLISWTEKDPEFAIAECIERLNLSMIAQRGPNYPEGFVRIIVAHRPAQ